MVELADQERARREAGAAYNRLLWRLAKLPVAAPGRAALKGELADAERTRRGWRGVLAPRHPE